MSEVKHSKKFKKYKEWYLCGFWSERMLWNVTVAGTITPEEYEEITGTPFEADE